MSDLQQNEERKGEEIVSQPLQEEVKQETLKEEAKQVTLQENIFERQTLVVTQEVKSTSSGHIDISFPTGEIGKIFSSHLGEILSNLSILSLIVGICLFFSFFIPVLYFCLLVFLTLGTLGSVFALIPNFGEWWALLPKLSSTIGSTIPISLWVLGATSLLSLVSLILMAVDKNGRSRGRMIVTVIVAVLSVLACFIVYSNLGGMGL